MNGGGEGKGRRRKQEWKRKNSESPVQMEATPPKASPASWGPSLPSSSERIEPPQGTHRPLLVVAGDQISQSSDKACSPYPPALREEAEPTSLEVRLLNPVTSV